MTPETPAPVNGTVEPAILDEADATDDGDDAGDNDQASSMTESYARSAKVLKQAYEQRIAEVTAMKPTHMGATPSPWRQRLLVSSVVVLVTLAGGWAIGRFTPFGLFAYKLLLLPRISSNSPQESQWKRAQTQLLSGTYQGTKMALQTAQQLLAQKSYLEARALRFEAASELYHHYGEGTQLQQLKHDTNDFALFGRTSPIYRRIQARLFWKQKNDQHALQKLKGSKDPLSRFLQGDILLHLRKLDEAEAVYTTLLTRNETKSRAAYQLGLLFEMRHQAKKAKSYFTQAAVHDPRARIRLAAHLIRKERDGSAYVETLLDNVAESSSQRVLSPSERSMATAVRAEMYMLRHEWNTVLKLLKQAQKLDPHNALAHHLFGIYYRQHNDPSKALSSLLRAAQDDVTHGVFIRETVETLLSLQREEEALVLIRKKEKYFEHSVDFYQTAARVAKANRQYTDAENYYRQAIKRSSGLAARIGLCRLFVDSRRFDDAKKLIDQAQVGDGNHLPFLVLGAQIDMHTGQLERARTALNKVHSLDPRNPNALMALYDLYLIDGYPAKALEMVNTALEYNPADDHLLIRKSAVLNMLGRQDAAIDVLKPLHQKFPERRTILVLLGESYLLKGRDRPCTPNPRIRPGSSPRSFFLRPRQNVHGAIAVYQGQVRSQTGGGDCTNRQNLSHRVGCLLCFGRARKRCTEKLEQSAKDIRSSVGCIGANRTALPQSTIL